MTDADIVIIGAGPAGIQAAIHASRKKVSVVLIGKPQNSAMAGTHVENLFGVPGKADGATLLREGVERAVSFGCRALGENVTSVTASGGTFRTVTETGEEILSKAVIIATGISRVKLGVPGEKEFFGKGVSYCAACDCNFYKGKTVAVIGDETEAATSAELMTKYASRVYWITKGVKASAAAVSRAVGAGAEIVGSEITEIRGDGKVTGVVLDDSSVIATDGVFIELGARSSVDIAMDLDVMPEADNTVKVDRECATAVAGVFACGDITGKPWQVAKAVGEGAVAGTAAANYVKSVS